MQQHVADATANDGSTNGDGTSAIADEPTWNRTATAGGAATTTDGHAAAANGDATAANVYAADAYATADDARRHGHDDAGHGHAASARRASRRSAAANNGEGC